MERGNSNTFIKNCGSDSSNFKNFRPVSNLSYISKLTESAVADMIQSHLAENNIKICIQCSSLHAGNFIVRNRFGESSQ